jgi:hypothetical protein
MTTENWLIITGISVNLIGQILAVLIQSRINRPKQTPVANQPPSRIQRIGGWLIRVLTSPWLILFFIFLNVLSIALELSSTGPLNRRVVFSIALSAALIVLNLGCMAFFSLSKILLNFFSSNTAFLHSYTDFVNSYSKTVTDLSTAITSLAVPKPEAPKPEPPKA